MEPDVILSAKRNFAAAGFQAVLTAMQAGQHIEAIKALRETTGLGLVEAKNMIEAFSNTKAFPGSNYGRQEAFYVFGIQVDRYGDETWTKLGCPEHSLEAAINHAKGYVDEAYQRIAICKMVGKSRLVIEAI